MSESEQERIQIENRKRRIERTKRIHKQYLTPTVRLQAVLLEKRNVKAVRREVARKLGYALIL